MRKGLCVPSAEEDERSCVRRAGSEVQAWGSWTRAREEAGNTRPGGHRPLFPGVAVAGEDLLPLPWFPWGLGTAGGRMGASRAPRVSTGPRPGFPWVLHRHHHLSATSRQRGEPPPVPSPHATPRSRRQRGLSPGRAPGRAAASASDAPAPHRPGSCQVFGRSLRRRLPRIPARAETGHGK